jgi:hypothetical protein
LSDLQPAAASTISTLAAWCLHLSEAYRGIGVHVRTFSLQRLEKAHHHQLLGERKSEASGVTHETPLLDRSV